VISEINEIALERSANRRWETGENTAQNALSKFYEILTTERSNYAIEIQPGFVRSGKMLGGTELWKRTGQTNAEMKRAGGTAALADTVWPDVVLTDLRGTARPALTAPGLLTAEMSTQMSPRTRVVAAYDMTQRSVGPIETNTVKPWVFDKYGQALTGYNLSSGGRAPSYIADIRMLLGMPVTFEARPSNGGRTWGGIIFAGRSE
jgi:hypothetical protein